MAPQISNNLLAEVTYQLSGPGLNPTDGADATSKLEKLASNLIGAITTIAVIFFIIQIIFAGFGFLSAQGDEKKMEINRTKLTNGILGLVIVVVAVGLGSLIAKILGLDYALDLESMFTNMGL